MKNKKSIKADLERKKVLFFEFGLCAALALTLMAFEFIGPREESDSVLPGISEPEFEIAIDITRREKPENPLPPAPKKPSAFLELIDNNTPMGDDPVFDIGIDDTLEVLIPVDNIADEPETDDRFIAVPEVDPAFPGGDEALYAYLRSHLVYPRTAIEAGIEGTVVVEFVVERDGSLSNVVVKRKVAPSLDEEAVRVVKSLPAWTPGKQKGKAVRSIFRIPIVFTF